MARVIQSPGVEINEIDLSARTVFPTGTNILIQGFSPQGPTDETLYVSTMSEFETIYGAPTNAAERYFYHTVKSTFNSPANILVCRLPYGEKRGLTFSDELYSALVLPVSGNDHDTSHGGVSAISGSNLFAKNVVSTELVSAIGTSANSIEVANNSLFVAGDTLLLEQYKAVAPAAGQPVTDREFVEVTKVWTNSTSGKQYIDIKRTNPVAFAKDAVVVKTDDDGDGKSSLAKVSDCTELQFGAPQRIDLLPEEYLALKNGEVAFDDDCIVPLDNNGSVDRSYAAAKDVLRFEDLPAYFKRGVSGSEEDYEKIDGAIVEGVSKRKISTFKDRMKKCGMLLVNKAQTTMNTYYEGYYIAFGDNGQFAIDDGSNLDDSKFEAIDGLKTFGAAGTYFELPAQRLNFDLTAHTVSGSQGSMSEVFENIPSFDVAVPDFKDTIGIAVFKLRKSIYATETTALDFMLDESHVGSLDAYRQTANINGGKAKSFYIETLDANSTLLSCFINKKISEESGTFLTQQGSLVDVPNTSITFHSEAQRYAWGTGTYQEEVPASAKKSIGTVVDKVERNFEKLQNLDEWDIDITLDAGLTTINTYVKYKQALNDRDGNKDAPVSFDDESVVDISGLQGSVIKSSSEGEAKGSTWNGFEAVAAWKAVANAFILFAQDRRKDHMTILDPMRYIFVQGRNGVTMLDQTKNFSQHMLYPLKNLLGTTSTNYAAVYGNWLKQYDAVADKNFWAPNSGVIAAAYANNDAQYNPWFAPAGFTRGLVTNALQVAIRPNQKQRDQFYKIGLNPIAYFPNDGYVIFGQKTMQAKPSAFDRINVRRLFLYLEKAVRRTIKYFVFEPNTFSTRQAILAVLTPIFQRVKSTQGMYDYLIVCDPRNNPPAVIDNNELVVDIYIKPVRAAEFILVNFYATRTDQNFSELIGG